MRDTPPAKREVTFASEFEKRHEERFRGVQFDWLDFQRDGQPFPVPNRLDPEVNPPQEIFLAPNDGASERQLTRLALRPVGTAWRPDGTGLVFTADSSDFTEPSRNQGPVRATSQSVAVCTSSCSGS